MRLKRYLALLAMAAACGGGGAGGAGVVALKPPPEAVSRGTFGGPLCSGDRCGCRDVKAPADGGAGAPEGVLKRFEVRIGPSEHELWVTLDDMVLYKGLERAEECFYVDLGPGDHPMGLRASNLGGIAARVAVSEYAAATTSWYETFRFGCGAPGVCTRDDLGEVKATYATYQRGIHDPCGSVKVKAIAWDTGASPDQLRPDDLQVAWTLDIYNFDPKAPHGDPSCARPLE